MIALYILAGWCVASILLGTIVCVLITRGKMDSHRRQHGARRCDADRLGRVPVGTEINNTGHGDHMPHAAE